MMRSNIYQWCSRTCLTILLAGMSPALWSQDILLNSLEDIVRMESKAANTRMAGMVRTSQASPDMDVHYYQCHWQVDPAVRYIQGSIGTSFTLSLPGSSVVLDFTDALTVDSVRSGNKRLSFQRPGNQSLLIEFETVLPAGTDTSLTIWYQGVPASGSGFGSFALSTHAGQPVMWTLSEPFGAMDWWPCKNGLDDKADSIDISITTPETYTGVSNGMPVSTSVSNGFRTTNWKHRYPISTYLVALAATNYVTLTDSVTLGSRDLPIIQHVYPESATHFKNAAGLTGRSLAMLHEAFGDYPFLRERYGHTQFSWGGGMEHQTNSFMYNTNETLIVHEAAHQWFGNQVTCGSWSDIWLNEGFALFCTNYNLELFHPTLLSATLRAQLNSITAQPGGSVWVEDSTNAARIFNSRLTYFKGGWLVRMLRWKLGDSAFFRGVRQYLQDPSLRYAFAKTSDLQRNLEAASGMDLEEFFQDWFYGQGHPSFQLTWTPVGNGLVKTSVSQLTSHPSVTFFDMPVQLRFWNSQEDTTIVIDHRSQNQLAYHRFHFMPDSAAIDPNMFLISAKNTVEKSSLPSADPNTVSVYPNPVGSSFQVFLQNFQTGTLSLTLFNAKGQKIWQEQKPGFAGSDLIRIETSQLPAGVYFLQVRSGNTFQLTRKILK